MKEPDWSNLPASVPPHSRDLLERCMRKDPKQRLQAIGDARIAIAEILDGSVREIGLTAGAPAVPASRPLFPWVLAIMSTLALAISLAVWAPWRKAPSPLPLHLSTELGADVTISGNGRDGNIAISPDGRLLAFVGSKSGSQAAQIYLRHLDRLDAVPLARTEGANNPIFSPDGQWIAFSTRTPGRFCQKVAVNGGGVQPILEESDFADFNLMTWTSDGLFLSSPGGGLLRIPPAGGKPEVIRHIAKDGFRWGRGVQILPGFKTALMTGQSPSLDDSNIVALPLPDGPPKIVQRGGYGGRYLATGHLAHLRDGKLLAAPFDLDRLEVTADPVPVVEGIRADLSNGWARITISDSGTLAYQAGRSGPSLTILVWLDMTGKTAPLGIVPGCYESVRLSPDGKSAALGIADRGNSSIWVYEWERGSMRQLTRRLSGLHPVWSPDSRHVVYTSIEKNSAAVLFWMRADGTGQPQHLADSSNGLIHSASAFAPDGKQLVFTRWTDRLRGYEIRVLELDLSDPGHPKPGSERVLLDVSSLGYKPDLSPDGCWIAYVLDREIYVQSFPDLQRRWQVSTDGGIYVIWARNGKELFYLNRDRQIMTSGYAVRGNDFVAEKPHLWWEKPPGAGDIADFAADGRRCILVTPVHEQESAADRHLVIVPNFFDELHRRVPVGGNK